MAILDVLKKIFAPNEGKVARRNIASRGQAARMSNLAAVDAKTGLPMVGKAVVDDYRQRLGDPSQMTMKDRAKKQKEIYNQGQMARAALGGREYSSQGASKEGVRTMAKAKELMDFDRKSRLPAIKSFYED